ncbi:MAG: malto-oligosyltrehalose synthase [Planctomycetaceae bacterium]
MQLCQETYREIVAEEFSPATSDDGDDKWASVEPLLQEFFESARRVSTNDTVTQPLYLLVEKILERSERLPDDWPVCGTSGYEFLSQLNHVFLDAANADALNRIYTTFAGNCVNVDDLVCHSKKLIMKVSMSSELNVLGHQLDRISERRRGSRDFTRNGLTYALREVVSCFPVYRTYTTSLGVLRRDRMYVEQAVFNAKRQNPAISHAVFDFIRDVLLLTDYDQLSDDEQKQRLQFIGRFQQYTGPVMAKAVEDTAFYRFNRLVSMNEVGSYPEFVENAVERFHQENARRSVSQPYGMLCTSTHDTKRSEDVRARINAISEKPQEWKERLFRWANLNRHFKVTVDGEPSPCRNDEYLLYQTLLGTWPFSFNTATDLDVYVSRVQQYMTKAIREAKVFSSWIAPNQPYEESLNAFISSILENGSDNKFRDDFQEFANTISTLGMWNSLSQTVLKLTSPGVPDIYQGTETWNFRLVDPDNRRPVDFAALNEMLDAVYPRIPGVHPTDAFINHLLTNATDGRIKLFVTAELLRLRERSPQLFTEADYLPLSVIGERSAHVVAFARRWQNKSVIVVIPRLVGSLLTVERTVPVGPLVWRDTSIVIPRWLHRSRMHNRLTGTNLISSENNQLLVASVLRQFPVAVLLNDDAHIG